MVEGDRGNATRGTGRSADGGDSRRADSSSDLRSGAIGGLTARALASSAGSWLCAAGRGTATLARRPAAGLLLLVVVLATAMAFAPATGAAAPQEIGSCQDITNPGSYELNASISGATNDCIYIQTNDVVLDGQGHTITMGDSSAGVRSGAHQNITIRNLTVEGGGYGIWTDGASGVTIRNVTVVGNTLGIKNNNGGTMTLIDVTARNNADSAIEPDASTGGTATRVAIGDLSGNGTVADFGLGADRYKQVDSPPAGPSGTEPLGRYFDVEAGTDAVDATIHYDPENVSNLDESRVQLLFHDGNSWIQLASTVDETNDTVSATLSNSDQRGPVGAFAPPATFGVDVVDATTPVTEGQNVTVVANLTNPSGSRTTQNVTLSAGGKVRDWKDVEIAAGTSKNVTFNWTTASGDAGSYDATVESAEGSDSTPVRVQAPANFSIRNLTSNEPVVEGDPLDVTATVENVGDLSDTQTLELAIGGNQTDTHELTLDGGQRTNVTLTWNTTGGDASDTPFNATVTTADDSSSLDARVFNSSDFSVSEVRAPDQPVVEGEPLAVVANVSNVGTDQSEQTIDLTIGREEVANATVALPAGNSTNVTLYWNATDGQVGTHTATVYSDNDNGSTTVRVLDRANFSVGEPRANDSIVAGDRLTVTANVTNRGEVTGNQTLSLALNDTLNGAIGEVATETASIGPGNSTNVTFTWSNTSGYDGDYEATVSSENDSNATTVTILAPANFSVGELPTDSPVTEGETLTVTANVTNVGDVQGEKEVNLTVPGYGEPDAQTVNLSSGSSSDVTLTWNTSGANTTTYTATVASPDSANATNVTVQTPPDVRVNVTGTNSPVWERENVTVNATVTNVGEATANQTIRLATNGTERANQTVTLDGGATDTVQLDWATVEGDVGDYTATVSSANETANASVVVRDPEAYYVTITGTNQPTEGENLTVDVRVSVQNGSDEVQNLTLEAAGEVRDWLNVSLNATESGANETLTWSTAPGDAGSYQLNVSTADNRATTNATVRAASGGGGGGISLPPGDGGGGGSGPSASLSVSIDGTNDPVVAGERLTVAATVTNDGDAAGTEPVSLSVDGSTVDSRTVTLAAGESTTVELAWTTGEGDAGDHRLRVATANSAAIRSVAVEPAGPLALEIRGTSSPVDGGRPLHVRVRATARSAANASVALRDLDGDRVATRTVSLASGESTTVTLTWLTRPADAGSGSIAVRSGPSVARAQVEVRQPPSFGVAIDRMRERAVVGEPQPVVVTVRSDAASRRTGSLSLQVDGRELSHRRIALDGGASASYQLEWTPTASDVGERTVRVQGGAGHDARSATVRQSSGLVEFAPKWASSSVDYRPTTRDAHVGGFLWLTGLLAAAGGYLLLSRRGLDARFLGVALVAAGVRTSTDVVHASVDAVTTEPLLVLNVVLELNVGLLLLGFAAAYVGEIERVRGARGALLAGASVVGSAAAATNGVHGLTFARVAQTEGAFTYASADLGPVGWVLLAATVASLVCSAVLLVRAFLSGADPAWRPVGVLGAGLALAVVLLGASVAELGPVPGYDYGGAAVGGFLLAATSAAIGHGLHRITRHAQASLIEDLDDPIVICNDARDVVECNPAAAELLPDVEVGEPFASAVGYRPEWPAAGETTESELSTADLLPASGDARTDGAGLEPDDEGSDGDAAANDVGHATETAPPSDAVGAGSGATETGTDAVGAESGPAGSEGELAGSEAGAAGAESDANGAESDAARSEGELAGSEAGAARSEAGAAGAGADPDSRSRDGPPEPDPGDAERQFYLVQTSSITADTGGTVGYTVRFTDVTALKTRSVELARKNEQLQRIASTISHDLRNPLTVATGYLEVLRDGVASGAPVHPASLAEQLEPVSESVARMEAIIDDVIALARGREPVSADERVAFGDVVEDAWSSVETGSATLFVESDGTLTADPRRLRRMFENLFRNAVEHGSTGSRNASRSDDAVEHGSTSPDSQARRDAVEHAGRDVSVVTGLDADGFHVADDGPGIPPEDREDVFEEGYTDSVDGTGLGLAIVRQLAEAHGWTVRLDPEYERGARFVFAGVDADPDGAPAVDLEADADREANEDLGADANGETDADPDSDGGED